MIQIFAALIIAICLISELIFFILAILSLSVSSLCYLAYLLRLKNAPKLKEPIKFENNPLFEKIENGSYATNTVLPFPLPLVADNKLESAKKA